MLLFLVVYLTHIATLAVCCLTIGLLSLGDALREKVLSPVRQPVTLVTRNCPTDPASGPVAGRPRNRRLRQRLAARSRRYAARPASRPRHGRHVGQTPLPAPYLGIAWMTLIYVSLVLSRRPLNRETDISCLFGNPRKSLRSVLGWISSLAMLRGGFLSAKERTALQAVMRHPSEIHGVARRANAILLLDDGWNCAKVAEAFYTRRRHGTDVVQALSGGRAAWTR